MWASLMMMIQQDARIYSRANGGAVGGIASSERADHCFATAIRRHTYQAWTRR
jgi:hypothetical protein